MKRTSRSSSRLWVLPAAVALGGCNLVLGIGDFVDATAGSGGSGGDSTTGVGGKEMVCNPGVEEACFEGPPGAAGVGICAAGTHVCNQDGLGYGPCLGQVVPKQETCNTPEDEDCDGETNEEGEGCACVPDATAPCYSGAPGTEGVGVCAAGTRVCNSEGTAYLPECTGEVLPGVEDCKNTTDEDCDGVACSAHVWSHIYGNSYYQFATAVAADATGNVFLFGTFIGGIQFGPTGLVSAGSEDVYVAKLDPAGNHVWSKRFGSDVGDYARAMAVDTTGNVILVGSFDKSIDFGGGELTTAGSKDIFVAKLDPDGNHVWSKRYGDSGYQDAEAVAVDGSGDVILASTNVGTVDFGNGPLTANGSSDAYLAKLSGIDGAGLWSKRFGDAAVQFADAVAVDPNGNIVLAGGFSGTINFGGLNLTTAGPGPDMFVARFTTKGAHTWSNSWGGSTNASTISAAAVAIDPQGDVVLTGLVKGSIKMGTYTMNPGATTNVFVGKLGSIGGVLWAYDFPEGVGRDVAVDAAGDILVTGTTQTTIDFGKDPLATAGNNDVFLAKLSPLGEHVWSKIFGDPNIQSAPHVATTPAREVLLACEVQGAIDFGGGVLTSAGAADLAVAKFQP